MTGELGTGRWSAADTSPGEIEAALRELLKERFAEHETFAPARGLNLVVVADSEWKGEIQNRLDRVGRNHASRTILCAVEPGRTTLDAHAEINVEDEAAGGEMVAGTEQVTITCGERHLPGLDTIVDPLVVTDLATLIWAPHGHAEAIDALMTLAQIVLVDSVNEPDPAQAMCRAQELAKRAYVVDLAWLRSAPWRERIAATFDPPRWRGALREVAAVTVRHHPDSALSGGLLLGWLASRLGWEPALMEPEDGGLVARARAEGRKVRLRLEEDATMPVPGLAGIAIETASGMKLSLFRGRGGLQAHRRLPGGKESSWVVVGASRGEAGILGEGIRQALLRDPTYDPALRAACEMLAA